MLALGHLASSALASAGTPSVALKAQNRMNLVLMLLKRASRERLQTSLQYDAAAR